MVDANIIHMNRELSADALQRIYDGVSEPSTRR